MKKLLIVTFLGLLTACSILGTTYSGNTIADNTLKSDVEQSLGKLFFYDTSCRVSSIHTEIDKVVFQADGVTPKASYETWTATGCDQTRKFNVQMIADKKGETDITVGMKP